jgi:hypothetical protein
VQLYELGYGFDCRPYNEAYEHTKGDHYTTNIVDQIGVCSFVRAGFA